MLSTPKGMKECGKCRRELPANSDFFVRDKSKEDGFKSWCKACRNQAHNLQRATEAAAMLERLDTSVVNNLAKAKPGGSAMPHATEIYQNVMAVMGGPQGFAMHFAATFVASKPGSQTRERMLSGLLKLSAAVSSSDKVTPSIELMDTDDLRNALNQREADMAAKARILPCSVAPSEEEDLPGEEPALVAGPAEESAPPPDTAIEPNEEYDLPDDHVPGESDPGLLQAG